MERKFLEAWQANREQAEKIGVRLRPITPEDALRTAHRCLSARRVSDGFGALADKGRLDLSLEALVVDTRFTDLFSDDEANVALARLLEAGYRF